LNVNQLLRKVDVERLYKHVLELEGPRHPLNSIDELDQSADYILSQMESSGIAATLQEFKVEGSALGFRNVEGFIGDSGGPELLIVSHYDTAYDSPGADDNGSGVAVMLECGRVLAEEARNCNVRCISFSLEEANFAFMETLSRKALELGLVDDQNRYTSAHSLAVFRRIADIQATALAKGKTRSEAAQEAAAELRSQLTESEIAYMQAVINTYRGIAATSWPGKTSLIGSSRWVESAGRRKNVRGVLCLEAVGYISSQPNSQNLPRGMQPSMLRTHNVSEVTVGNFLAVIGDANSDLLAQSFCKQCELPTIDLPYACFRAPLQYKDISALGLRDLLRSDHAPFWQAGIPALMLTDTANFRYPFYHTKADTIDKLNFEFMTKVCRATLATVLHLSTTIHA
jgi:hypothetical protein